MGQKKFLVTAEGEGLYLGENGIFCDYDQEPPKVEILTSEETLEVCRQTVTLDSGASGNADRYGLYYEGQTPSGASVNFVSGFTQCSTEELSAGGKNALGRMKKQLVPVCNLEEEFTCPVDAGMAPNDAEEGGCACVTLEWVDVQPMEGMFVEG
jgi:hypothetical protein